MRSYFRGLYEHGENQMIVNHDTYFLIAGRVGERNIRWHGRSYLGRWRDGQRMELFSCIIPGACKIEILC